MAEFTENYQLIKPSAEDYYDVQDFNENMDTIDGVMAEVETAAKEVSEKIGTAEDTGSDTVFGKLNQMTTGGGSGLTAVKSIQRVTLTLSTNDGSASQSINTVVPENCIVLMDRLHDGAKLDSPISYTLHANRIDVITTGYIGDSMTLLFQIIELC